MRSISKVRDENQALKAILQLVESLGYYGAETLGFLELRLNTTKLKGLEKHFL
jgi:hypothetical protein